MNGHCVIGIFVCILVNYGIADDTIHLNNRFNDGIMICPNGWVVFEGSCYLFADVINIDWTEATHFCASHDHSHIVTVESKSEALFLQDQCRRLFKTGTSRANWFWVGATDDEVEGIWVWYTNHKPLSGGYINWMPGEPNGAESHNEDCAVLWGPGNYLFGDYYCDQKSHVICERNITMLLDPEILG